MTAPSTLQARLARLADDAPPGGPEPDLWERGRRYQRHRRVGTTMIVAVTVLVLGAIGGAAWQRSASEPAPADDSVGLPDRVWEPSPWLPSTDRPGRLVALSPADRATWTGRRSSIVTISATSGDYTFLDLPGADLDNGDVELAPDGRHVAYWLTGPTTDTPESDSGPITGVAVYDTSTGEVRRHWIRTPHGLMPNFLSWTDPDTVVYSAGQIRGGDDDSLNDQSSAFFGTVMAWTVGADPRPVTGVARVTELEGAAHGWILVDDPRSSRPGRAHLLVDVANPSRAREVEYPAPEGAMGTLHFVAVGSSGRWIALVPGNRTPGRVQAGPVNHLQVVPHSGHTFGVVDWLDAHTIVTLRRASGRYDGESALYRVATTTGESRELVRFPVDTYGGAWQFATDLLAAPSVDAVEPPTPLDPRAVTGTAAVVTLGGVAALVLWRRRVRP